MIHLNKVILSGRLTCDPEVKYSKNDNAYARVGIAVDRPFSKGKDKEVDFFNLVVFGKTAEFLGKYFSKGSKLLVEGTLQTSEYKDKDGNDRKGVDVIVNAVEFADSKKGGGKKESGNDSGYTADGDLVDAPF